jgi:hypothetical protein
MPSRLTSEEFIAVVVEEFALQTTPKLDDRIIEDVGLDSMQAFNLVALVEEMIQDANGTMSAPSLDYPVFESLSDAYRYLDEHS